MTPFFCALISASHCEWKEKGKHTAGRKAPATHSLFSCECVTGNTLTVVDGMKMVRHLKRKSSCHVNDDGDDDSEELGDGVKRTMMLMTRTMRENGRRRQKVCLHVIVYFGAPGTHCPHEATDGLFR